MAEKTKDIQRNKNVWERKAKEMFSLGWDNGGDKDMDKDPSDNPSLTWFTGILVFKLYTGRTLSKRIFIILRLYVKRDLMIGQKK